MSNLENTHIIITGASRGLGRALAELLHKEGARVSLFARNSNDLSALAQSLGERVAIHAGDVSNASDIEAALRTFRAAHGPVDVLINNAGFGSYKPFHECDIEELVRQIDVNVSGLVRWSHAVAGEMIARRSGTMVHVASDLARKPLANMAVYTATKHAVAGFSQSLARELRHHGVRSVLFNPGIINTHFGGNAPRPVAEDWQLDPTDAARAVQFLISQPPGVLIDELAIHPLGQDF